MLKFKLYNGDDIEDLELYIKEYYKKNPDSIIFVGADSAQHGKVTKYATTISFLRPRRGTHIIYSKFVINREKDLFNRLWKEVECAREVAEYVDEILRDVYVNKKDTKIPIIHLDFNRSSKYKSHIVHDISIGYLTGIGFEVYCKPSSNSWSASIAADHFVKN